MSHPLPFSLSASSVLVGGSRSLLPGSAGWVACQAFTQAVARAGHLVHVGCATGADQAALICCPPPSLRIFATFNPQGVGGWAGSAVSAVQAAAQSGAMVSWLAGGDLNRPLVARLMARSLAALAGCSAAVFFAPGPGSLKVARAALRQGIPILIWCLQPPPVLAVPSVRVSWLGQPFWLFAPPVQSALF